MGIEDIIKYYNAMLPRFEADDHRENPRHVISLKRLEGLIKAGHNVLDIGCGVGTTTRSITNMGALATGIDIAPDLIDYANKWNTNFGRAHYICGNICDIKLEQQFDIISLIDVIEHIPWDDMHEFFRRLYDWSNEETTFYVNLPDGRFTQYMQDHYPEKLQPIDNVIHHDKLLGLFRDIGFECIEWKGYGIDTPIQYCQGIFVYKDLINKTYKSILTYIYQDSDKSDSRGEGKNHGE